MTAQSVAVVVLSITLHTHESNNNINIYIIIHMCKNGFEKNATTTTVLPSCRAPDAVTIKVSSGILFGGMIHEQKQLL